MLTRPGVPCAILGVALLVAGGCRGTGGGHHRDGESADEDAGALDAHGDSPAAGDAPAGADALRDALDAPAAADAHACTGAAVVISQVYGGGGNVDAPYQNDFVELHNRSGVTVSLAGWAVQYASAGGGAWQVTALSGSIAPGGYYLVAEGSGTGCSGSPCGSALPAPDATGAIPLSASAGQIALVRTQTALGTGTCPTGAGDLVDLVGYGSATCAEGSAAPTMTNLCSISRAGAGCTDTGDNGADLSASAPPTPRSSSSPASACADC
jgi:uncharacterized protein